MEVVTSKFHMRRVKAAFEWVWGMPLKGNGDTQIRFVSTRDVGLSEETLIAREEREIESERQLRECENVRHAGKIRRVDVYDAQVLRGNASARDRGL